MTHVLFRSRGILIAHSDSLVWAGGIRLAPSEQDGMRSCVALFRLVMPESVAQERSQVIP